MRRGRRLARRAAWSGCALALTGCLAGAAGSSDRSDGGDDAGPGTLHASIEPVAAGSATDGPLELRVEIVNRSDATLAFLPVNTPFEAPLGADVFVVERDGRALPYLGVEMRRLPIEQAELVPMAAGETRETVVDLAPLYPVDVPGEYSIRYAPREMTVGAEVTTPPARIEAIGPAVVVERTRE